IHVQYKLHYYTVICATAVQESTFSSFWFWMGLGEEQAQSKKIFQSLFMFQFQVYLLMNKEAKGYRHKRVLKQQLKEEEVAYDAAKEISQYNLKGTLLREDIGINNLCATAVQESTFSSFQSLFMFQFQVYLLMNKEEKGYRHKQQLKEEEVAYDAAKEFLIVWLGLCISFYCAHFVGIMLQPIVFNFCFNTKNKEAKGYRHKEEVAYDAAKEEFNYFRLNSK
ncbi:hypothetical protein ACJX0J_020791, partial [Zea mays]